MDRETAEQRAARHAVYQARRDRSEWISRSVKLATTYLRKAADALGCRDVEGTTLPVDVGYWTLLERAIDAATEIVEALGDEFFESSAVADYFGIASALGLDRAEKFNSSDEPLEAARKLVAAIEQRRRRSDQIERILALENVEGRTAEEAAAFLAKAAELRARL